jgi:hypothetical protein
MGTSANKQLGDHTPDKPILSAQLEDSKQQYHQKAGQLTELIIPSFESEESMRHKYECCTCCKNLFLPFQIHAFYR